MRTCGTPAITTVPHQFTRENFIAYLPLESCARIDAKRTQMRIATSIHTVIDFEMALRIFDLGTTICKAPRQCFTARLGDRSNRTVRNCDYRVKVGLKIDGGMTNSITTTSAKVYPRRIAEGILGLCLNVWRALDAETRYIDTHPNNTR